mgnify:CR=1 FL=1
MTETLEKHWYLIHTYSGHEDKVRTSIEKTVSINNLGDKIQQVVIPTEEVIELKKNKNVILFRTNMESGHAGASGRWDLLKELAEEVALEVLACADPG